MSWNVVFDEDFAREFRGFDKEVKIELRAMVLLLEIVDLSLDGHALIPLMVRTTQI